MTRLITEWIESIEEDLRIYDAHLKEVTGMDLSSLAFYAAGMPTLSKDGMKSHKAAVIRVTAGKGVIGSLAESVAATVRHMGAEVFIPDGCDVSGIYEALTKEAKILFMADDDRFIAFNVKTGKVAENDSAVALGYVAALSAMSGGLSGKEVLQIGFGRLGRKTLERLLIEGAAVSVYDRDSGKTSSLRGLHDEKIKVLSHLPLPLSGLVMDVTNEGGYLKTKDLSDDVKIAAPGVPLSLDEEAYKIYHNKIIHDPLQTGVAVMLAMTLGDG